ncbi:hypothetical protein ACNSOL_11750 (plasmid) [Aliarcobacter lanthieri]|uniref:hypothetical protein n=1 Tax=Aliarcobacter lanthieri TaxID=1355374 RepID=UPI003AAFC5D7
MANTEINKFTKLYVSNKKNNEKLYFTIDYEIKIKKYHNEQTTTSIILDIHYLYLEQNLRIKKIELTYNKWKFSSTSYNQSCNLHSSVMISTEYRSYGIGTFVLNEIIKIANKYTPSASLSGFLSPVDEGEDNKERRNSLYRNIGFIIEHDKFYIEKISDLHLDRKLEYIQTLNYSNIFDLLYTLQDEKINLLHDLKNRTTSYQEIYKEKNKCHKKIKYIIGFIVFISILIIVIL